ADRWRLGVNVQYCAGWIRTQQNHYVGISRDVAATFDDRLLELCGYRLYKGTMGHVDGHAPGEVVFGERMAERAYTYERYRGRVTRACRAAPRSRAGRCRSRAQARRRTAR